MNTPKSVYALVILAGFAINSFAQTHVLDDVEMEIISERNMNTKVFLKSNGDKQAVICGGPVHYQQNNHWEEINTTIWSTELGYQNESNVIRSYFPNTIDGSTDIKFMLDTNNEIFVAAEKKLVIYDPSDLTLNIISTNPAMASVNGNTISYPGIYPGMTDEYHVLNGEIKNNLILNALPDLLTNLSSGYFGFQESIQLPLGWTIIPADPAGDAFTSSSLLIIDSKGEHVLTLPAPVFFDHDGYGTDGENVIEGKYLFNEQNGKWNISTLVPVEWLKDGNRQYPVSIDPTLIIPGTTGGWQSPNNFVDNAGFVFIGVCCGNLTHRAWIKFNTSAIPDGTCIQNVELQVNVYTEANATAELTHVTDVTGAFGPYGGIVPAAYNDFGTGLYTSFTITGLGTYGYYSLGASACALLQAQLPLNWFQPALMFNNEPSTNYKNINGTSSNLRVTYPCALPVELISFDANCDNDRVNLTWNTASEINNHYFTVGKSKDGVNYEVIGTVTGGGNSNQSRTYSFVDPQPSEGTVYYYLKQTDYDGTVEYLDLATVNCSEAPMFSIYPNPGSGVFMIDGVQPGDQVIITDLLGQVIFQTNATAEKMEINLEEQLGGTYFVQRVSRYGVTSEKLILNQ
jgi:hypothetical protein